MSCVLFYLLRSHDCVTATNQKPLQVFEIWVFEISWFCFAWLTWGLLQDSSDCLQWRYHIKTWGYVSVSTALNEKNTLCLWHWPSRWLANEHYINWLSNMRRPLLLRKPGYLSTNRRQELCNHVHMFNVDLISIICIPVYEMNQFQFSC